MLRKRLERLVLLLVVLGLLGPGLPRSVQAAGSPPRSQSVYGMDILGQAWQWTFPRVEASPRMSGPIRVDLLDSAFRQAAGAGVRWNRLAVWWCMVEPERDQWVWDDLDAVLQLARNYGMETSIMLLFTPYWAVNGAPPAHECINNPLRNYPPSNMADWDAFVRKIVQRYGAPGKNWVSHWEIWNEPDLWEFLVTNPPGGDTRSVYAELLNRAARVIRAESPGAKIITGGVSDIRGATYLDSLFSMTGQYDVRQSFDIVGYHSYNDHTRRLDGVKAAMAAHGVADRLLWDTELNNWGWDYATANDRLASVYQELESGGVARSFWFTSCTTNFGLGIFNRRTPEWEPIPFQANPFYDTFRAQAASFRLPGQPTVIGPGPVTKKPVIFFEWETATPGDHRIVGYKLQLDNAPFLGAPYFAQPEYDIWVSAERLTFMPFLVGRGRAATVVNQPVNQPPRAQSILTWSPGTQLPFGLHYWRVAAVDIQGNVGPYTEPRPLTVKAPFSVYLPQIR